MWCSLEQQDVPIEALTNDPTWGWVHELGPQAAHTVGGSRLHRLPGGGYDLDAVETPRLIGDYPREHDQSEAGESGRADD